MPVTHRPGGAWFHVSVDDSDLRKALDAFDPSYRAGLKAATNKLVDQIEQWIRICTQTWSESSKPTVKSNVLVSTPFARETLVTGMVDVEGDVFSYVDQGTRPHPILPVSAKMLRFQTGYTRKTPNKPMLGAIAGGPHGEFVFRRAVQHPGTEAQDISGRIWDLMEKDAPGLARYEIEQRITGVW